MSAAAQQQKAAASTSAAGAEQEEVEHGPFPIEQLQVRTRLPLPSAVTLAGFFGSGSRSPRAGTGMGGFSERW